MIVGNLLISCTPHPVNEALDIGDPRPGVCNPLGQILYLRLDRLNIRGEGLFLGSQCDDFLGLSLE